MDSTLAEELKKKGVILHAPAATVIEDVGADAFEAGVEIFPGVTIRGTKSRFGANTKLGRSGGGYFENVVTGKNVDLYGGFFQDCALFDDVIMRGHAEVRGGTLLEEGCESAHHVGYKMTVMLPWVVAGSLVNFCDVLMGGGTSRRNHSEIGSSMALYNFTPWGDKHASMFGDVPRGVFVREAPIFIGGQTQIVSPVLVGFGTVLPAGCSIRRNVPDGQMYGEAATPINRPFNAEMYGAVEPKVKNGLTYLGNLVALQNWYVHVRRVSLRKKESHRKALYEHAQRQLQANVDERVKRLRQLLERLDTSLAAHQAALDARADDLSFAQRYRRIDDHQKMIAQRPQLLAHLESVQKGDFIRKDSDAKVLSTIAHAYKKSNADSLPCWIRDNLPDALRPPAQRLLSTIVDEVSTFPFASGERG